MDIRNVTRTQDALLELGGRLKRLRLERNERLADVARRAGVGVATLERMEAGSDAKLTSLVRVLRALNRLGDLDVVLASPEVSPFSVSERTGSPRRRASSRE